MHIVKKRTLQNYWEKIPETQQQLQAWYSEAKAATWKTPQDILARFPTADILKAGRVIFNICGNRFRLIVKIRYDIGRIFVRFIGTHKEYDKVDAETI